MEKSTPGPWHYEKVTKTIRSESNYWLCSMDSFDGAVYNEANARLIAAAPELLSAAKAMDEITLMIDRGLATVADLCHTMKQLQAAIAKAEGK